MHLRLDAAKLSVSALNAEQLIGVMLFGEDRGQVWTLSQRLLHDVLGNSDRALTLQDLDDADLKDRHALSDAFFADVLTQERRVIRIRDVDPRRLVDALSGFEQQLTETHQSAHEQHFLLMEMPNLTPASPLRKYIQRSKHLGAFPCYLGKFAQTYIQSRLEASHLKCPADVKDWLEYQLQTDTGYVHNELERLSLYVGSHRTLTLDAVKTVIEPNITSRTNAITVAAFAGATRYMNTMLTSYWHAQGTADALLSTVFRFTIALYAIASGHKKELPAQFTHFSIRNLSTTAMQVWNQPALKKLLLQFPEFAFELRSRKLAPEYTATMLLMRLNQHAQTLLRSQPNLMQV